MKTSPKSAKPYPSDVSDEEWSFVAPYLTLCREDSPQRDYPLRSVFNALRWLVRSGAHWRMMPHDFPPWPAVYQQTHRWLKAGERLAKTLEGYHYLAFVCLMLHRLLPLVDSS